MTIRFTYEINGEVSSEELTTNDPNEFVDFHMTLMQEGCRILKIERLSEVKDV